MLVSVVVPVAARQRRFLDLAIACIERDGWPDVEIVLDDGPGPIGAARNRACRKATGDVIAFVDVDDPTMPGRFARQIAALDRTGALVCGTSLYYCVDLRTGLAVEKASTKGVFCGSLMFMRAAFQEREFEERNTAEANSWLRHFADRSVDMHDRGLTVYTRHPFATLAPGAPLYPLETSERATVAVRELLGTTLDDYRKVIA